jgi:predicted transcriptional regulator
MKYRSRTDIVEQILESAQGGATKTRIMYKAYLSYGQLKEYLSILMENNLLEHDSGKGVYTTTPKGIQFLRTYGEMGRLSKEITAD